MIAVAATILGLLLLLDALFAAILITMWCDYGLRH